MIVKFKKLSDTAITPHRAHHNDAGYDLFADEDVELDYADTLAVKTNIAIELPDGYVADIRPRSGLTLKTNLRVHYGTIDAGYRDGIGIICENASHGEAVNAVSLTIAQVMFSLKGAETEQLEELNKAIVEMAERTTIKINKGDKIAQLVIHKLPEIELVETQELNDSERGLNGFGSTDCSHTEYTKDGA